MALNLDSLNSIDDDIANIIPSPKNNNTKELIIDEESKLGKVEKEIDSFGDISGINNENNEILNDNSLIMTNKNILNNNLPKAKNKMQNLEIKIKNFFENSKINNLTPSITRNLDLKFNPKHNLYDNSKQNINNKNNKFDLQSIRINNDKKYNLLFEKNKKLDINSLREEYFKIKKDNNNNLVYNYKNLNNKEKKYISIFNNNYDSNKLNTRHKKYNNSYKKSDYNFKYYYKTNNNSKDKDKDKEKEKENEYTGIAKFNFLKNKLFNEKKSSSLFNINFYNNFSKKKKDNNNNNQRNTIFNSLRNLNKSSNSKDENDSWILNTNNKDGTIKKYNFNKHNNIYNSNINLNIKNNYKSSFMIEKLKSNRNISKNYDFKYINPKSSFMDFKNINNNRNKNKISFVHKYNNNYNKDYYYNLTNEEKNNSNLEPIKNNNKIPYGKMVENNDNLLDKFSDNFDAIFNFVENKIKHKINNKNEFNSRYKSKLNFKKINPKLLSISQNVPKRNHLMKVYQRGNNKNNNKFQFPVNKKINIMMNEEITPFRKIMSKDNYQNNFCISNYSYNDLDYPKLQNKKKNLLNLL